MGQKDTDANSGVTLEGIFHQFQLLKTYNCSLRILISIGGSSAGTPFKPRPPTRDISLFVKSCVDLFINGNGFLRTTQIYSTGSMSIWEFPGSNCQQRQYTRRISKISSLCFRSSEVSSVQIDCYRRHGVSVNQYQLATASQLQSLLGQLAPFLNYFNVMTYDYSYQLLPPASTPRYSRRQTLLAGPPRTIPSSPQ